MDPCLFFLRERGRLTGILCVHVDDILIGGQGQFFEEKLKGMKTAVPFLKWRMWEGEFCGSSLIQLDDMSIKITQKDYTKNVRPITIRRRMKDEDKASPEIATARSVLGAANWLACQTHVDLAMQTNRCQEDMGDCTIGTLKKINMLFRRTQQHNGMTIHFQSIELADLRVAMHSAASCGNAAKAGAQAGYLVSFADVHLMDDKVSSLSLDLEILSSPPSCGLYASKRNKGSV